MAPEYVDTRLRGASQSSAIDRAAGCGRDLRVWRAAERGQAPLNLVIRGFAKLSLLTGIAATILFVWQGVVLQIQHFSVRPNPAAPIALSIARFIGHTWSMTPAPGSAPAREQPAGSSTQELPMNASQLMNRWEPLIALASKRFGVPELWIRAVMKMESGGRTVSEQNEPITSRAGAMGVMQIMPGTYENMRAQYRLGPNPYNPHDNIFAGAAYLRWLSGRYGYPAMFAAYNDGPGNLESRVQRGKLLPAETRNYVGGIVTALGGGSGSKQGGLAKLTRPDGSPVSVDVAAVVSVRAVLPGEYAPGVQSVITIGRLKQGVRESVATVAAAIRAHGGAYATLVRRKRLAEVFREPRCTARVACMRAAT